MRYRLSELQQIFDLDHRTLRYIVEHDVVPGLSPAAASGRGQPRCYNGTDAREIVLAAILQQLGMRRRAIPQAIRRMRYARRKRLTRLTLPLLNPGNTRVDGELTLNLQDLYARVPL